MPEGSQNQQLNRSMSSNKTNLVGSVALVHIEENAGVSGLVYWRVCQLCDLLNYNKYFTLYAPGKLKPEGLRVPPPVTTTSQSDVIEYSVESLVTRHSAGCKLKYVVSESDKRSRRVITHRGKTEHRLR